MKTIDCRNMACPLPVVTVKRALEEGGDEAVEVILDAGPPRENVTRFVTSRGYVVKESPVEGGYALIVSGMPVPRETSGEKKGPVVFLISSDRLGDGPEDLGRLLMKNFLITLLDVASPPDRIFFVNSGVLLSTEGSELLEALARLGDRGTEVFSCGVCLDYFHRREKLRAGEVTNMFTIAESLLTAGSVVRV